MPDDVEEVTADDVLRAVFATIPVPDVAPGEAARSSGRVDGGDSGQQWAPPRR